MDWIFEHFQLAVVLAVVAVALVRKLYETLTPPNKPAGGTILESLEDLFGPAAKPDEATPPPLRKVATPPPLRKVTLAPPPPLGAMDAELQRQHEMQERLRKIRETKTKKPATAEAPAALKRPVVAGGMKSRLRSGTELRRAIVVREILGPPVSLR